jgi:hypothetical protein
LKTDEGVDVGATETVGEGVTVGDGDWDVGSGDGDWVVGSDDGTGSDDTEGEDEVDGVADTADGGDSVGVSDATGPCDAVTMPPPLHSRLALLFALRRTRRLPARMDSRGALCSVFPTTLRGKMLGLAGAAISSGMSGMSARRARERILERIVASES